MNRRSRIHGSSLFPSLWHPAQFPAGHRLWCSQDVCRCRVWPDPPWSADQSESRTCFRVELFKIKVLRIFSGLGSYVFAFDAIVVQHVRRAVD